MRSYDVEEGGHRMNYHVESLSVAASYWTKTFTGRRPLRLEQRRIRVRNPVFKIGAVSSFVLTVLVLVSYCFPSVLQQLSLSV